MAYPEQVDTFHPKLNKRTDGIAYAVQEELAVSEGRYDGLLAHDNIATGTMRVYTGPDRTGEPITGFVVSIPSETPWRRHIRIFAEVPTVYVVYETPGDQVDADDINALQEAVTATQTEVERYREEGVIDGGFFDERV